MEFHTSFAIFGLALTLTIFALNNFLNSHNRENLKAIKIRDLAYNLDMHFFKEDKLSFEEFSSVLWNKFVDLFCNSTEVEPVFQDPLLKNAKNIDHAFMRDLYKAYLKANAYQRQFDLYGPNATRSNRLFQTRLTPR